MVNKTQFSRVRIILVGTVYISYHQTVTRNTTERQLMYTALSLLLQCKCTLCVGIESGVEANVHSMREIFAEDDTEGVIQVDANNAFNTLNRSVLLLTISGYSGGLLRIRAYVRMSPP